jgi:hypothetical protein
VSDEEARGSPTEESAVQRDHLGRAKEVLEEHLALSEDGKLQGELFE